MSDINEVAKKYNIEFTRVDDHFHAAYEKDISSFADELRNRYRKEGAEQQARHPALERFKECDGFGEPDAIERLRFFCSCALRNQDWLDIEQFFDAAITELTAARQEGYGQGKQAGRDEVLRELSEREPVATVGMSAPYYALCDGSAILVNPKPEVIMLSALDVGTLLIIRPSAPIADTKGDAK
jgi:hypothetical protein